ncbi:TPR domain-containing protein [Tirmania nivea]|nr:TPR domain-containing protein [Tirmania nivea]
MPRIEELPDDPPAAPPPSAPADSPSTAPALPPAIADIRSQSTADFLASMSRMPLFGSSLSELDPDQLSALTALAYEGTPGEIASNFKEQGNDAYRHSFHRDAAAFYTKALSVAGLPADDPLREQCLANRAAANLELGNYGSVLRDCSEALKLNPRNVKAHYRSASALAALQRWEEAALLAQKGLALDPANAPLRSLLARAEAGVAKAEEKRLAAQRLQEQKHRDAAALRVALRRLGIKARRSEAAGRPDLEGHAVKLDADGTLVLPTIVLYPLAAQSDFIPTWREDETAEERLGMQALAEPPPWDERREYAWKSVEVFMETVAGGLVKVGKKVPLGEALGGGKVEVVDDLVKLMVVPRGRRDVWIDEWKKRRS